MSSGRLPIVSREDLNAFWALFADNLANFVMVAALTKYVLGIPDEIIFSRIFPGLGVALLIGLGFYSWRAHKLARDTGRTDVTALPYGISTPVLFVYTFGVMLPVKLATDDGVLAWQVGIAAAFIGGLIEISGSFLGPLLKRITPRAGMLGTLAGIALVYIGTVPLAEIFESPVIAFPALAIVFVGLVAGVRLPFNIPAGLLAIVVGVGIALTIGEAHVSFEGVGLFVPVPVFGDLINGFIQLIVRPELLVIIVPLEIYNFIETMNNVESAEAAGDEYPVRQCQIVDGLGTVCGSIFGSAFPTTVYIGHPGYKRLGGRAGYALMVGVILALASFAGLISFLHQLIPVAVVAPMLVFIAMVICGQAFAAIPKRHVMAGAVALMPHVGAIIVGKLHSTRDALNDAYGATMAFDDPGVVAALLQKGVHFTGQTALANGAIISGLIWGGMTALLIDLKLRAAAGFAAGACVCSLLGLIHAPALGWHPGGFALGYGIMAVVFGALSFTKVERITTEDTD